MDQIRPNEWKEKRGGVREKELKTVSTKQCLSEKKGRKDASVAMGWLVGG